METIMKWASSLIESFVTTGGAVLDTLSYIPGFEEIKNMLNLVIVIIALFFIWDAILILYKIFKLSFIIIKNSMMTKVNNAKKLIDDIKGAIFSIPTCFSLFFGIICLFKILYFPIKMIFKLNSNKDDKKQRR